MKTSKTILKKALLSALFIVPSAVVLAPQGCTKGKNLCDLIDECQPLSDRGFDDCVDGVNGRVAQAKALDCGAELEAVYDCYVAEFDCDDADNEITHPCSSQLPGASGCTSGNPDCEDEERDLFCCEWEASDLPGNDGNCPDNPTAGPGPGPGPGGGGPGPGPGGGAGPMCCECGCTDTMLCPGTTVVGDAFMDCTQTCDTFCTGIGCGTASTSVGTTCM
jgi:hypothetical protein